MDKWGKYMIALILVIAGYFTFDFAYYIGGTDGNIIRIIAACLYIFAGMLIKR